MRRFIVVITLTLAIWGCDRKPQTESANYKERCQKIKSVCEPDCIERTFRACFVDTELFPEGPYDPIKNCHAVHVGNLCAPCQQLFSINTGGAMRAVECEEFFEAVARKNEQKACRGCLRQIGDSPFDYKD